MATSDRSLFLETIKTEPLSVNQIIERFNVARSTATIWAKHELVEPVPGSYPRKFKRKDSFTADMSTPKSAKESTNNYVVSIPRPPQERVHGLWQQVMDNELPHWDFIDMMREADSRKNLSTIKNNLLVGLTLIEYYDKLMEQDGVE